MSKDSEELLRADTYQAVEEINREFEMITIQIYTVAASPNLTLETKKDQIDLLAQQGINLLEAKCGLLGRAYHRETGPFIAQISRLKDSLLEKGDTTKTRNLQVEVNLSKPLDRKPFIQENNHKFDKQRDLQNIFIKADEASFPKIARGIGLIKTLKEYNRGLHRKIIISLQKRMNPKFKKFWGMMLSSKDVVNGLYLIRTKNF